MRKYVSIPLTIIIALSFLSFYIFPTQSSGTLKWSSGFENPVSISFGGTYSYFHGSDNGYDWNDLYHWIYYEAGDNYPDIVEASISTSSPYNGTKSLLTQKKISSGGARVQLNIWCNDGIDSNSKVLDEMGDEFYVSWYMKWTSPWEMGLNCWRMLFELREYTGNKWGQGLYVSRTSSGAYKWYIKGRWNDPVSNVWYLDNDEDLLPNTLVDSWFKVALWIKRDTSNGEMKVWINDSMILYKSGMRTKAYSCRYVTNPAKLYADTKGTFPINQYVDDLQYWTGIPPSETPSTYLEDDFEDGTLHDPMTGNLTNGSGAISLTTAQANNGTYSANVTGVNGVDDYAVVYKDLEVASKEYYWRSYFMIDTLPINDSECVIYIGFKDQTENKYLGRLLLRNYTMTLQAGIQYYDSGNVFAWTDKSYSVNTWYEIQIHVFCDSSDGKVQLWWDGELLFNKTSLTNNWDIERVYTGVGMWYNNSFALNEAWFDSLKLDTSYIPSINQTDVIFGSIFFSVLEDEGLGIGDVKINGTYLTESDGIYVWENLTINKIYTFIVEKPSGYYPAWCLNVEGTFAWNGTHYILSHNVTEEQYLEILFQVDYFPFVDETYGNIRLLNVFPDFDPILGYEYAFAVSGSGSIAVHSAIYDEDPYLSGGSVTSKTYNETSQICNLTVAGATTIKLLFNRPPDAVYVPPDVEEEEIIEIVEEFDPLPTLGLIVIVGGIALITGSAIIKKLTGLRGVRRVRRKVAPRKTKKSKRTRRF